MQVIRISFLYTLTLVSCLSVPVLAQKARTVKAEYSYTSNNRNETPSQAIKAAIQQARYEAIRIAFGERVTGQTDYIASKNGSGEYEIYREHGGTELKADWIETIKEEVREQRFENGVWTITVYVEGKAMEIVSAGVDFEYHILRNGTELRHEDKHFKDNDRLYLMFKAPTDGYLAVYVVDDKTAYCVLPYAEQTEGIYRIKASQDYLFFSEKHQQPGEESCLFTNRVTTDGEESVINDVYLIFSPNPFTKKTDRKGRKLNQKLTLARNIEADAFAAWLAKCRKRDNSMSVERTSITIRK